MKKQAKVVKKTKALASTDNSRRFDSIEKKLDRIIDSMVTQREFRDFKSDVYERIDRLEDTVQALVTAIENLSKSTQDIMLEYAVIAKQMNRYDRWFKEIAEKLGIELKP